MNKFFARRVRLRYASFTLVELLVVIAIIAILAAATLSVGNLVINEAKKTKAQNTAVQIQTAVSNYYTEYSVYPTATGTGDYKIDDTDMGTYISVSGASTWGALIDCLSGNISPSGGTPVAGFSNNRAVAFLSLKSTDVTLTGTHEDAPLNPLPYSTGHLYFNIVVDAAYAGILGKGDTGNSTTWLPNFGSTFSTTGGTSTAGVAVWANCNPSGGTTSANWYVHTY